nr:beta family protein [Desulfosporosinus lacus]
MRHLREDIKDKLCPVFMVLPNNEAENFIQEVIHEWGENRAFYMDFHSSFSDFIEQNTFISSLLSGDQKIAPIPIVSPNKNEEYFEIIKDSFSMLDHGIAIRLTIQDFDDAVSVITDILDQTGNLSNQSIDLIIDLGQILLPTDVIKSFASVVNDLLSKVSVFKFRRTIVCGSSFPESLSVRQGKISSILRIEWAVWKEVIKKFPDTEFGDYGADDPKDPTIDHVVTMVPTIRYTHDESWYIVRGTYDRRAPYDYAQFHKLSKILIAQDAIYCGKDFSNGDLRIFECANKTCSVTKCNHGNLSTWVQIAVNHHLTYVALQASSSASS